VEIRPVQTIKDFAIEQESQSIDLRGFNVTGGKIKNKVSNT
jgi:hypothetical protein